MTTYKERILELLVSSAPNELNALTIAQTLDIPPATTNTILSRLFRSGEIKRPIRGFYAAVIREDTAVSLNDDDFQFHPVYLRAPLLETEGRATFLTESIIAQEGDDQEKIVYWILEGNKRVFEHSWQGRRVRIEVSAKSIEIMVPASERPLSVPDLAAFLSFLEGLLFPDFWLYKWEMPNWGVNIDRCDWYIDGAKSISLRSCMKFIARWYNKKGVGLRREVHAATPIKLEDVVGYLKGGPIPQASKIEETLERTETALNALRKDYVRTQAMLARFLTILHDMNPEATLITYDHRRKP